MNWRFWKRAEPVFPEGKLRVIFREVFHRNAPTDFILVEVEDALGYSHNAGRFIGLGNGLLALEIDLAKELKRRVAKPH